MKNTGNALPLNKPKSIGIIGNGAGSNPNGANGFSDRAGDSGVLAIGWGSGYVLLLCTNSYVTHVDAVPPISHTWLRYVVRYTDEDRVLTLLQPVDAITARAKTDGTTVTSSLSDTDMNGAAQTAAGKDVAFVFITADSG